MFRHNLLKCLLVALTASVPLMAVESAEAEMIGGGQWLQLNFSDKYNAATADNFNYFITFGSGYNSTTGSTTTMIDSEGNLVDASLSLTTAAGPSERGVYSTTGLWVGDGTATPANAAGKGTSTWSAEEYTSVWWTNGPVSAMTITISGLNPALTYDVYHYQKFPSGTGGSTSVDVNGISKSPADRATCWADPDEDLLWTGISLNPSNQLVITMSSAAISDPNPFVSSIVIGAVVPEPNSLALLAAGLVGMLAYAWRKRK